MSFLRSLFRKPVPEWAKPLTHAQLEIFLAACNAEVAPQVSRFELNQDTGVITAFTRDNPETRADYGLHNLILKCAAIPQEEWREVIRSHFQTAMTGSAARDAQLETLAADWSQAREVLRVRLQPEDHVARFGKKIVAEQVAPDLYATLVYDFPTFTASVHPDHAANWGVPLQDLVQTGLRNIRSDGLLKAERVEFEPGSWVDLYEDPGNPYTASHLLLLHEYLQPEPEFGALASVPNRDLLLVHPIRDMDAVRSLNALLPLAFDQYERGPYSITPAVYWYRHGVFTHLPYEVKGGQIAFYPPASFIELALERLAKE